MVVSSRDEVERREVKRSRGEVEREGRSRGERGKGRKADVERASSEPKKRGWGENGKSLTPEGSGKSKGEHSFKCGRTVANDVAQNGR